MKAVVLAAGEGNRMRPLTYTRPKVMLPLANKPILEHLLEEAIAAGIREFVLVVGYHDEQVRRHFGRGERWRVSIDYVSQRRQQGTADAVRMAEGLLAENFLVLNGDMLVSREDISGMTAGGSTTIGVIEVEDPRGLGVVEVDASRVVRVHEKEENPPSRLANAGLYFFTPAVLEAISCTEKSPRGEYELTDSLNLMIAGGQEVAARPLGRWLDLSYPWDLLAANETLLGRMQAENLGEIEDGATVKGAVSIGKNTVIRSGAYVVGPVSIGEGCEVGPNCYIRPCTAIGDGCHIGSAVEVKNCIIMSGSKLPHHNYAGDSVIGEGCNFGAGTKTANLRLDRKEVVVAGVRTGRKKLGAIIGDNVQTGINASINVGAVIGNNAFIGPGAVASGIIMPDSRIF